MCKDVNIPIKEEPFQNAVKKIQHNSYVGWNISMEGGRWEGILDGRGVDRLKINTNFGC